VKRSGVCDQYLENLCFAPPYSLAKEIIDKGGLGNVYYCKARESGDIVKGSEREKETVARGWQLDPNKSGGGMLMDTGIHAVQYVRYIFDRARAIRVHAEIIESIGLKKPKGIEDAAFVTMRFDGNKIGIVDTSLYATGGGCDDTAEIYGDRGPSTWTSTGATLSGSTVKQGTACSLTRCSIPRPEMTGVGHIRFLKSIMHSAISMNSGTFCNP
jgi:predicted dehydrogenase